MDKNWSKLMEKNWIKIIPIINHKGINQEDKILQEIQIQRIASSYDFTPKIINIKVDKNNYYIEMENLNSHNIAYQYGEEPYQLPRQYWDQIHSILKLLFYRDGIEYIDITPYNFIVKNEKVYLIDFGHAHFNKNKDVPENWFLREMILSGHNLYNPDFK